MHGLSKLMRMHMRIAPVCAKCLNLLQNKSAGGDVAHDKGHASSLTEFS